MGSSSTAEFRKTRSCPSAETLLLYRRAGLGHARRRKVVAHLAACDFCSAELQLLAHHPATPALPYAPQPVPMPAALCRLAEDLLSTPARLCASIVGAAVVEGERLTLTDA